MRICQLTYHGALLLAGLAAGCTDDLIIAAAPGDIAVGARFRFAAVDLRCDKSGAHSLIEGLAAQLAFQAFVTAEGRPALAIPSVSTATSCQSVRIDKITEVTSSDPAVFAVVDSGIDRGVALFEVEARAAGAAEIRVAVETPRGAQAAAATFRAAHIGHIELNPTCPPSTDESYVPSGGISDYDLVLQDAGGRPLLGFGALPFSPSSLALSHPTFIDSGGAPSTNFRRLIITWPTQRGDLTVTSPADASFRKAVTIYDQRAYTAAEITPASGTPIDLTNKNGVPIAVHTQTGDRKTCWYDPIPRHYYTDTPSICTLSLGLGSPTMADLPLTSVAVVIGVKAGACRLHADVPNTPFALVADFPVR